MLLSKIGYKKHKEHFKRLVVQSMETIPNMTQVKDRNLIESVPSPSISFEVQEAIYPSLQSRQVLCTPIGTHHSGVKLEMTTLANIVIPDDWKSHLISVAVDHNNALADVAYYRVLL